MRFLVDASPDARHVAHLRSLGHDVTRVGTDYPAAMKDIDILALAYREQRILVTDDRDFGELVFRLRHPHAGIVYLRLGTTMFPVRAKRVEDVLAQYEGQLDQFVVVTMDTIRVRRSDEP